MSVCRFVGLFRLGIPLKLMSRWSSYNVMNPGGQGTSYGDVQRRNKAFCDNSKDQILKIVENLVTKPHLENEPFTVAEYGAADGSISMELMTDIISVVRSKCGINKEIHVMYEDLPENDFNSLYKRIHGIIPNPRSYLLDHENVYVTSTGTNFYKQCFPSNSVDLALSFSATQWLSKTVYLYDHVYPYFTQHKDEKDTATKQAADDWVLFLKNRTKELKPGGWGVFATLGGRDATLEEPVCVALQDGLIAADKIWKILFDRGIITKAELKQGTYAFCFRSPCELEEPIRNSIELQNMGLKLHEIRLDALPCFYVTEWKQKLEQGIDDREGLARGMTQYIKTPTYNSFYNALSIERSEEQKSQICESVFKRMEEWFLSKHPGDMNPYCFYTSTYVQKE
ncbi:uncharacterized protein LOC126823794 isoform X2 [Patella vulgata]|uniref:uncharacterized protein LOC126823794 isoform X2 n=1 Tax=Patella vulgata TaxID=6465 RepID=UPI0024A7E78A|nr:uncharacterized protein LOC126823794 isoform X2 [Patella vulgata]